MLRQALVIALHRHCMSLAIIGYLEYEVVFLQVCHKLIGVLVKFMTVCFFDPSRSLAATTSFITWEMIHLCLIVNI